MPVVDLFRRRQGQITPEQGRLHQARDRPAMEGLAVVGLADDAREEPGPVLDQNSPGYSSRVKNAFGPVGTLT